MMDTNLVVLFWDTLEESLEPRVPQLKTVSATLEIVFSVSEPHG